MNSFYPYAIKKWNALGEDSNFKPSVKSFNKHLYVFARPLGIKLLTKIRVSFSDVRDHRFNHNFNCDNPLCSCDIEDETSYINLRSILLSKISDIICSDIIVFPGEHLLHILLYGSNVYNPVSNELIITETIIYIRNSGRFTDLEAFR